MGVGTLSGPSCAPSWGAVKSRNFMDLRFSEDLELRNATLRAEVAALPGLISTAKLTAADKISQAAEKRMRQMASELAACKEENSDLASRLREMEAARDAQEQLHDDELKSLRNEIASLRHENGVLQVSLKKHTNAMRAAVERAKSDAVAEVQEHNSVLRVENEHLERLLKQLQKQNHVLQDMVPSSPQTPISKAVSNFSAGPTLAETGAGLQPKTCQTARDDMLVAVTSLDVEQRPRDACTKSGVLSKLQKPPSRPRSAGNVVSAMRKSTQRIHRATSAKQCSST